MIGHGNKRGKSLRMIAREAGKETFQGKRCGCGSTTKKVSSGKCISCKGKYGQIRAKKESDTKSNLVLIAHRAFNVVTR